MLTEKNWYSLSDAANATDLSKGMIKYLVHKQLVRPGTKSERARGARFYFSFADLVILRAIARMLEQGIEVSRLKRDLNSMRKRLRNLNQETARLKYLATDGFKAYLLSGDELVEEVRSGQFAFRFMLNVGTLRYELVNERKSPSEIKRHRRNALPLGKIAYRPVSGTV